MVRGCISVYGVYIWKATINAEDYMQVLKQHMLSSREDLAYFSKTMLNLILHPSQQHGFTGEESGC